MLGADDPEFLTTRELAALLRLSERKIYDLAASGEVPCVRVVGKLLFPRTDIASWIGGSRTGPQTPARDVPQVLTGSHDPLLDWALRESGSGIAAFFDGSHDGLSRLADGQALACGLHIHEAGGWNVAASQQALGHAPVVLVEFARRIRGIVTAPGNPLGLQGIGDIASHRFARRQGTAASQRLFAALAREAGIDADGLPGPTLPARTEADVAMALLDGTADVAFGLEAVAAQFKLGFIAILEERFDLLVWRRAWFEPGFQRLMHFAHSQPFADRAAAAPGYDTSGLGTVHLNGDAV